MNYYKSDGVGVKSDAFMETTIHGKIAQYYLPCKLDHTKNAHVRFNCFYILYIMHMVNCQDMKKKLGVFFCQPIRSSLNNSEITNDKKKKNKRESK